MMATEAGSKAGLAKTKVRHRTTQERISGAGRKFRPPWESIDLSTKSGRRGDWKTKKRILEVVF